MKVVKLRKGISPIIATVLLILIAIATGIVIYAFMAGWIGTRFSTTSGPQAVLVAESGYYNATKGYFVIYVRNDGSRDTNISRVYVIDNAGNSYLINSVSRNTSLSSLSTAAVGELTYSPTGATYLIPAKVPANGSAIPVAVYTDNSPSITRGYVYTIKLIGTDGSEVTIRIRA